MAGKIRKSNLHDDVKTMVTDMISEQALDSANFDSVLSSKTTDDITEGSTNQYYTTSRFDSDFSTGGSFTSDVSFADGVKAKFGGGHDLQIYHDGTNSYISDADVGNLSIMSNGAKIALAKLAPYEFMVEAIIDGAVNLYYDGVKKLETSSNGVNVSGRLQVSGGGTSTFDNLVNITDETNDTRIAFTRSDTGASGWIGIPNWDTDALKIYGPTSAGNELAANYTNQRWSLYGGGSLKFNTTSTGVSVTGELTADSATIPNLSGDVTFTGNLQGPSTWYIDPAPVDSAGGLLVIRGDLQVDGTTTTVNSTTVSINDKNIVLADSAANAAEADGAGITVNGASATISYDAANDEWDFNKSLTVTDSNVGNPSGITIKNTNTAAYSHGQVKIESENGAAYSTIFTDAQNDVLRLGYNTSGATLNINSSGNVGIGTTSPNGALHISRSDDARLKLTDTGDSCTFMIRSDGVNTSIGTDTAHPIRFMTNNLERMRITSAGSVLAKNGAADASQFIFNDGWGAEARNIRVWAEEEASGGIGRWFSFLGTNVSKDGDGTYTKPSDDASSNWGNIAGMLFTEANNAGQNAIDFVVDLPSAHGGGLNESMSGSDLYNKSAMSITADSNVGIGTRSPSAKLHVQSTATSEPLALFQTVTGGDASIRVEGVGGEAYIEIANTSPSSGSSSLSWGIGLNDNLDLYFGYGPNSSLNKTNGSSGTQSAFLIDTTGNIGINHNSPAEKLHVDGHIRLDNSYLKINRSSTYNQQWEMGISHLGASDYGTLFFYPTAGGQSTAGIKFGVGNQTTYPLSIDSNGTVNIDTTQSYSEYYRYKNNGTLKHREAYSSSVSDSIGSGGRVFIGDGGQDIILGTGNSGLTPNNSFIALNHGGNTILGAGNGTGRLFINGSTGFVGVNVGNPSTEFQVYSTDATHPVISLRPYDYINKGDYIGEVKAFGTLASSYTGTGDASIKFGSQSSGGGARAGSTIEFWTNADGYGGTSPVKQMEINRVGSVTKPNQPAFMATKSTGSQIVSGATATKLAFNNTIYDINGDFDTTNNRFYAPVDGRYLMILHVELNSNSVINSSTWFYPGNFYVNGSQKTGNDDWGFSGKYHSHENVIVLDLNTNDYVEVFAYANNNSLEFACHSDATGYTNTRWVGYLLG